jgi:hypothetical protein
MALAQGAIAVGGANTAGNLAAVASGTNSIAIGSGNATTRGAMASAGDTIAIGRAASSTAANGIALGSAASASGANSVVVGTGSSDASFTNSIIVGQTVTAVANNQMILGSSIQNGQILTTGSITTPNATPAILYDFTLVPNSGNMLEYFINATLAASTETGCYTGIIKVNDNAGTVTIVSIAANNAVDTTLIGTNVNFLSSGANDLTVQVVGLGPSVSIKWSGMLRLMIQPY